MDVLTTISFEALLLVAVFGIYLVDATLLLFGNELVIWRGPGGGWRASFGSRGMTVLRRAVAVPEPWWFHQPVFRLAWAVPKRPAASETVGHMGTSAPYEPSSLPTAVDAALHCESGLSDATTAGLPAGATRAGQPKSDPSAAGSAMTLASAGQATPPMEDELEEKWAALADAFQVPGALLWGAAVGLFVLLPMAMFGTYRIAALSLSLLLTYGCLGAALTWTYLHRREFGLGTRDCISLVLEYLTCPPRGLNLVRRLTLQMPTKLLPSREGIFTAQTLLSPIRCEQFCRGVVRVIDEMSEVEEDFDALADLHAWRSQVTGEQRN